jgi:uncharacterized Zn finger protein
MMEQQTDGKEIDTQCPICGGTHLKDEFAQVVTGQVDGPQQAVELVICGDCGHFVSVREVEA